MGEVAEQEIAPATTSSLVRGFCHECSKEVAARELADESFECQLCREPYVECPYDSFENWEGSWQIQYQNGYVNTLTISSSGSCVLACRDPHGGQGSANLQWAPEEHEGFLMRLEGHYRPGVVEHLRQEDGLLHIRHATGEGGVVHAEGRKVDPTATPVQAPVSLDNLFRVSRNGQNQEIDFSMMAGVVSNFLDGFVEALPDDEAGPNDGPNGILGAVERGFARVAAQTPGLSEAERQALAEGSARLVAPLAQNFMFGGMIGRRERQRPQTAVSEEAASHWIEVNTIAEDALYPEWSCPICYDGSTEDVVLLCGDLREGERVHAVHGACVLPWLVKRDECPVCRRTPIVGDTQPENQSNPTAAISEQPPSQDQVDDQTSPSTGSLEQPSANDSDHMDV